MGILKDYFSFSKRERIGSIVLVILIVAVFVLPDYFPPEPAFANRAAFMELKQKLDSAKFEKQSSPVADRISLDRDSDFDFSKPQRKPELFPFDPNTLPAEGWQKLGLSDRTIQTIQKYLSKGGKFRTSEDLGKMYGLRKSQFEMLQPFVRIAEQTEDEETWTRAKEEFRKPSPFQPRPVQPIDINLADSSAWVNLSGIGARLARRIILFREKLGGFYSIDQVGEVYGLPDSTFNRLKPLLECREFSVDQINLNSHEISALKAHPYIKWQLANAIAAYRQEHGSFSSVEDLKKIEMISEEMFVKIRPYLKAE